VPSGLAETRQSYRNSKTVDKLPHTVPSLGHSLPALYRTRVRQSDVFLGPHPSLPNLRRRQVPLFGLFGGTATQSDPPEAYISALWVLPFAHRSRSVRDRDASEVSRFSCMLFLSVPWFSDYAEPTDHSRSIASGRVAFPNGNKVMRPDVAFSKLDCPAHWYPAYASTCTSQCLRKTRAKMDSLLLCCRTLSFLQHASLSRRTSDRPYIDRNRPLLTNGDYAST
jgi:hypothetical protein